ncbi:MAG: hypothetical protein QXF01_02950, partial [Candidatus Micrarchaeaceae archaeon]
MKKSLSFKKQDMSAERIRQLLNGDLRMMFKKEYADARDLILHCGFTSYVGNVDSLFAEMESRKRNDFLFLTYLGKMRNALRTAYTNCDLSNLAFLSRLNRFAELLHEASGKSSKIMVAAENKTFDNEIFVFGKSK